MFLNIHKYSKSELAPPKLCAEEQTDLKVHWEVVEQDDLQQQLLSSDDVGRQIQGQEEILEHRELQEDHIHPVYCFIRY